MSSADDAKRLRAVIKDPDIFKEVQKIASDDGVSFNVAMKRFYSKK